MNIVNAVALRSFCHENEIKTISSPPFPVSKQQFSELKSLGLVTEATVPENPLEPAGPPSSSLPAGQVSPEMTAKQSDAGATHSTSKKAGKKSVS